MSIHKEFETIADNGTPATSGLTPSLPIPPLSATAFPTNSHECALVLFEGIGCKREGEKDPREGTRTGGTVMFVFTIFVETALSSPKLATPALHLQEQNF